MSDSSSKTLNAMLLIAATVVVIAGMKASQSLLVPFLLAGFIAVISASPLLWLERKGVPAPLAVLIVIFGILLIGVIVGGLVSNAVADFSRNLPAYEQSLKQQTSGLVDWLTAQGVEASRVDLESIFAPAAAMQLVGRMLNSLGAVLTNGFLILLTVVFMLLEATRFPNKLRAMIGGEDASLERFSTFVENVQQYIALKTWISLATGVLVTLATWLIGVDYPLLWGLVAFAFNYVPNIGSIIAGVPAVLLAFIQLGPWAAAITTAAYVVINVLMGSIIEPRYVGKELGLSTLIVFVSLVFWGWVLGPVGMLLSVPLTITAKIALDSQESTRWLAILLGPEIHDSPPADS
ncbi:MAG: AI-2E family transporter [Gammaproteobacteria bacterium]